MGANRKARQIDPRQSFTFSVGKTPEHYLETYFAPSIWYAYQNAECVAPTLPAGVLDTLVAAWRLFDPSKVRNFAAIARCRVLAGLPPYSFVGMPFGGYGTQQEEKAAS